MFGWLVDHKIPLGSWLKVAIDFLNDHAQFVFDFISTALGAMVAFVTSVLLAIPAPLLIVIIAAGAYALHRSIGLVVFIVLSLLLVVNLGYWQATIETLSLVIWSTAACVLIGVPVGIVAAHRPWVYTAIRPILDLMQTIPTFVYLIPTLVLFGLGTVPGIISTVIFALPAPIRLTQLGISSVPLSLREAALAYGATPRQMLFKVELPSAMPTILAGITQCIMLSLSMVVIAALVGADGLGKPVVRALNSVNISMGFEAGIAIVILAIILDRVCKSPEPRVKRRRGMSAVELQNVDIVFGRKVPAALALADKGKTRDEIQKETGALVGAFNVSLAIEPGEICVLMGLSGSGKSTILRAVNGLNKVARGKVLVSHEGNKIDVVSCRADMLRAIRLKTVSMVFQSFGLLPWRSVRDNVGFGLEIRGMSTADRNRVVNEKLEIVGLSNWADKPVQELSGGMQQRVGLARAFATDADILLMDEPFSALDPLIRDKLQDDLLGLQKLLHKTIIFVSHDLGEALKIGNRIAIMEGGHVVQYGTPTDIVLRPANAYVSEFVKRMNPLDVLKGDSVMTPAATLKRQENAILLDESGDVRLMCCAEGKPERVRVNGREGTIGKATVEGNVDAKAFDLIVAPMDMPLKAAMDLRCKSDYPIVFVDQLGRLAGMCDHEHIYKALLQRA